MKKEPLPFNYYQDSDFNSVYSFLYEPTLQIEHYENAHKVKIVIDELNDSLVIKKKCTCKGHKYGKICKHIKRSLDILKEKGVEFRENEQEAKGIK